MKVDEMRAGWIRYRRMACSSGQLIAVVGTLALTLGLASCGETASTSKFKGESHGVAQTIADFQTDATARDQQKLCQNDLAANITGRLQKAGGCQAALKDQLLQLDAPGLAIESIALKGSTASARVKSTYSGKSRITTLTLVKEGSRWKISAAQ